MSNSAAISAAKRRRNVGFDQENAVNEQSVHQQPQYTNLGPMNPVDLLKKHDYQLFALQNKMMAFERDIITLDQTMESLELNDSTPTINSGNLELNSTLQIDGNTMNKIENNQKELNNLKATVNKLINQLNETTSLVTTLRASLMTQTQSIENLEQLKSDFYKFVEENKVKPEEIKAKPKEIKAKPEEIKPKSEEIKARINNNNEENSEENSKENSEKSSKPLDEINLQHKIKLNGVSFTVNKKKNNANK
jgi:chromosome segregation ATPase